MVRVLSQLAATSSVSCFFTGSHSTHIRVFLCGLCLWSFSLAIEMFEWLGNVSIRFSCEGGIVLNHTIFYLFSQTRNLPELREYRTVTTRGYIPPPRPP